MKHYWLRLFPDQLLAIDDELTIPAQAIRGALASVLLSTCIPGHQHDTGPCHADCRYWSMFGEESQFTLGPAFAGTGDETRPVLHTMRTCAAYPGFKAAGGHGIFDITIRQFVFEQVSNATGQTSGSLAMVPPALTCQTCDSALVIPVGTATRHGDNDYALLSDIATPVTSSHASLAHGTRRVVSRHTEMGKAIRAGVHYVARADVPEPLVRQFEDAVRPGLWIGGRRSRGMGFMRTELVQRPSDQLSVVDRVAQFNRAIRSEGRFYAAMGIASTPGSEGEWFFTLDLNNPAIPASEFAPSIIKPLLGKALPSVAPVRLWIVPEQVSGWHTAAGLPRRAQAALSGVILCRVPAEVNRAGIEAALKDLESDGIGLGRERGFGAITVCDPFHTLIDVV